MLILITYQEALPRESELLNEMLMQQESLLVHVRKPEWSEYQLRELLEAVEPAFRKRLVIHSHHHLAEELGLKGAHLTETDRKAEVSTKTIVSTSFHDLATARKEGERFDYFFCSPVFDSISKAGHRPTYDWNISSESKLFRSKAVALGGVKPELFSELKIRGFEHFAILGYVWQSDNPLAAIRTFAP